MIFVFDSIHDWCGDLDYIDRVSETPEMDKEFILEAINDGIAKRGEEFRVGPYICYATTELEERAVKKYWKAYAENRGFYAGDTMTESIMSWVKNNDFVDLNGSVFFSIYFK